VRTVALQSTGVYWIPLYDALEERGFQVYLVNARHTKNLPGGQRRVHLPSAAWGYRPWVEVDFAKVPHCLGPQFLESIGKLLRKILVADQE